MIHFHRAIQSNRFDSPNTHRHSRLYTRTPQSPAAPIQNPNDSIASVPAGNQSFLQCLESRQGNSFSLRLPSLSPVKSLHSVFPLSLQHIRGPLESKLSFLSSQSGLLSPISTQASTGLISLFSFYIISLSPLFFPSVNHSTFPFSSILLYLLQFFSTAAIKPLSTLHFD